MYFLFNSIGKFSSLICEFFLHGWNTFIWICQNINLRWLTSYRFYFKFMNVYYKVSNEYFFKWFSCNYPKAKISSYNFLLILIIFSDTLNINKTLCFSERFSRRWLLNIIRLFNKDRFLGIWTFCDISNTRLLQFIYCQ